MATLVIHHKVRDYDAWKAVFDDNEPLRRDHGATEHRVYRDAGDPNRVVIHTDFPSLEAAKGFMGDAALKAAMERAGVEGEPGFSYVELAERKPYA
ncbi:MAG: antibiotic biosynthesis monooxygenase [Nitrososphaerota archaeon]